MGWRPPGPFRRTTWRSPLRGAWLPAFLGLVLLAGMSLVAITGLFSYAAYNPRLGNNDLTPDAGLLHFYLFDWPTSPAWLFRANQGIHVILGITLVPVVLAKLWAVAPKLYEWPPATSVAQALERINITLIIGSTIFQMVTGILNVQYDYVWGFSFYEAHLYGAWVFIASFVTHTAIKFPTMVRSLRERSIDQVPEPPDPDELTSPSPAAVTLSRRALVGWIGASSATLFMLTAGQTLGGPLRRLALLAPRGRDYGDGPNDFQVNTTAEDAGIRAEDTGESWRLELVGRTTVELDRDALLAMPLHTEELPIACVEGWSTVQTWRGVRLVDLAALVESTAAPSVTVESIQQGSPFAQTTLSGDQLREERSLLALEVNGVDISPDHGFPARVIVPANPGVHNTKWVRRMVFGDADG